MSALVGTQLSGRYRLDAQVGTGGMSTVYRAFDATLERRVAIKLMHRDIAARLRPARALPPRGPRGRPALAPAHRRRDRRRRGGRPPVHRLRVRRGRDAQGPHPPARPAAGRRGDRLRDRDRPRARRRARPRDRPPRRQAPERARRRGGLGQGHRLRHRPLDGRQRPDRRGPGARHHRLRLARAGARPRRQRPVGHLLARHRALRDAHGRRPVPRREPGVRGDEARPRGPARRLQAPPRGLGRPRGDPRPDDLQGPAQALPGRAQPAGRPRGGAGARALAHRQVDRRGDRRPAHAARRARAGGCRCGCAARCRSSPSSR